VWWSFKTELQIDSSSYCFLMDVSYRLPSNKQLPPSLASLAGRRHPALRVCVVCKALSRFLCGVYGFITLKVSDRASVWVTYPRIYSAQSKMIPKPSCGSLSLQKRLQARPLLPARKPLVRGAFASSNEVSKAGSCRLHAGSVLFF
jgi:hypothetical protein